jgi:ribonuclease HI
LAKTKAMPWEKRSLRGTVVFARTKDDGSLDVDADGRVDVRYKADEAAKIYRAAARNLAGDDAPASSAVVARATGAAPLAPTAGPAPAAHAGAASGAAPGRRGPAGTLPRRSSAPSGAAIVIYTDGACAGNPGPMGVGVVIQRDPTPAGREEIGEYIGTGTNNIAELTAIERALDALGRDDHDRRILVHADSSYAIGVLSGAMKAKKNVDLIARIRAKANAFPHLTFVKVRGHAGVAENERCDALATTAVARARRMP